MKYIIYFSFLLITTFSCTKKIEIDPPKGEEAVIIQAYLFNDSICRVQVTKSTDYLSNSFPPRISTALITLSDNNGNSEVLNYNSLTSTYEGSTIIGIANTTYTLKVDLEGKIYQSSSILPTLYPGDSIVPRFKEANAFEEKGWRLYFFGKDPKDELNYYYFKCYGDGKLLNESNQVYVSDDKFLSENIDGVEIDFPVLPNQKIDFKFMSLTKPCFEFYNAAQLQLNNDGGFFSTPPANVPSMFDNGAIGIFQCSTLQLMQTQVPNYMP